MGRKAISGKPKSDRTLRIRLTDEERERLDAMAEAAGVPTSSWARDVLFALADRADRAKARAAKRGAS